MEAERAADILRALADGVDPFSGEVLDDRSPLQNPECVRALFAAIEKLEGKSSDRGNAPFETVDFRIAPASPGMSARTEI